MVRFLTLEPNAYKSMETRNRMDSERNDPPAWLVRKEEKMSLGRWV